MPSSLCQASGLISELSKVAENICLFRCYGSARSGSNIIAVSDVNPENPFLRCKSDLSEILSPDTVTTLYQGVHDPKSHYTLLLSDRNEPILAVSSLSAYQGLCMAIAPETSPESALAFLQSMPHLSCIKDPRFPKEAPPMQTTSPDFRQLSELFRSLFTFFESSYSVPSEFKDPFQLFRLLRLKILPIAELYGLSAGILLSTECQSLFLRGLPFDLALFECAMLLLLSAFHTSISEHRFHAVFTVADSCPMVCIHFPLTSGDSEDSAALQILKSLFAYHSCYCQIYRGEPARREIQKLPGIQHMLDPYRIIEHVIIAFSPIKRDWSSLTLRSPIFRLPDHFYDSFDW